MAIDWSHLVREQRSASTSISTQMTRLIEAGALGVGDRIPAERELSAQLGVSRATVREALRDLELRGLVTRTPGRGTIVAEVPRPEMQANLLGSMDGAARVLREIMDLRAVVEPPICERAATRATTQQVVELRSLVETAAEEHEAGITRERYIELDLAFHTLLAGMTHNPILERLLAVTNEWMAPSRSTGLQTQQRIRSSLLAHQRILDAVERRDASAAHREMAAHIHEIFLVISEDPAH